jgi:hypothetical protein
MQRSEDPSLIVDATAYVDELYREITAENVAADLGVQNQAVNAILADAALSDSVRAWAAGNRNLEATMAPPQRLPINDAYRRIRAIIEVAVAAAPGPPPVT